MLRQLQHFQHPVDALSAATVGKIPIAPDFGKPLRQYVLLEPADKLAVGQYHLLLFATICIILPAKSYLVGMRIVCLYAMVTDGYFVRVAA